MNPENLPAPDGFAPRPGGPPSDDLLRRLELISSKVPPQRRLAMVGKLLAHIRANIYPWMHILQRADGSVVVTISPPPAGDQ
ncbi:hypothetical protein [Nocardia terpenica]|uniref:Uncharacterized protein n=1 Tax=Nocardia terpenica TaxID=455432 RepID=A0A164JVU9_9NOCA|nr:hypothetical protein [Nocardia terpenica]KZM70771.1 hypothetical protein AWN90_40150 [Nocardia terpenica]NQE89962.1 hypothetical protein [Nocardia terpenica]